MGPKAYTDDDLAGVAVADHGDIMRSVDRRDPPGRLPVAWDQKHANTVHLAELEYALTRGSRRSSARRK